MNSSSGSRPVAASGVEIRPLADADSLEFLTDLLHHSYAALARLGLRYVATYQSVDVTRQRIARGACLVARRGVEIVGTVTYYPPAATHGSPWLDRPDVAHFGQLAVVPSCQRLGFGAHLVSSCEERARSDHAHEIALDTAEPASHLIAWYERLGYRFVEYVEWEMTNYRSVVMSKALV